MSQTASISRDSLIQLGRSGRPWQFLAMMHQIGDAADSDHAIVFVHAANLARLGLKELATRRLESLPPQVCQLPDVTVLARAIQALPAAAIPRAQLESIFDINAHALVQKGAASQTDISQWRELLRSQIDTLEIFRASDGNIVIPSVLEDDRWDHDVAICP